jgi:hypothetical protein
MKRHISLIRHATLVALAITVGASAAHAQKASTTYKGTGRDPFIAWRPAPPKKKKNVPLVVTPPPIQARIEAYKAQKAVAMNLQQPAPKATTALLLGEMQLIGIFRTPRGWAAMIEATPIKLSFVVYPGEKFYDGMLVAIEENRLVCRKETRWTDGRRELGVEFKPLGQPNAVKDSVATTPQPKEPAKEKAEQPKAPATAEQTAAVKQP